MSWIKEVDRKESQLIDEIYQSAEKRTGEETANVLKVHSLHPELLKAHMNLYEALMFDEGPLSRQQREMIGVVVSTTNQCPYCASHHGQAFKLVSGNQAMMDQIRADYHSANLSKADLEICRYAEKLTKHSYRMVEDDVIKLRALGFSDQAILDINQIASYFNYVNRVVDGLGVELE